MGTRSSDSPGDNTIIFGQDSLFLIPQLRDLSAHSLLSPMQRSRELR
ncbi:hypothetical protein SynA1840_01480 [Synechococcus sp. A18-40]|nr:hypothetical protein SynA1840_01480 [Synechococcus sp. A18-40]